VGEGVPLRLCEREALPEALAERRGVALVGGERVLLALPAPLPLPLPLPLMVRAVGYADPHKSPSRSSSKVAV